MENIENKIEKLLTKSDELEREINRLFENGQKDDANKLYYGEYTKCVKQIAQLSKKMISSF